jgi:hypothetical protein
MIEIPKKAQFITYDSKGFIVNDYASATTDWVSICRTTFVMLKNSSATHNLTCCFGNTDIKIGGQDNWKAEQAWKDHKTFDEYKTYFKKRFGREYDRDENRWRKAQKNVVEKCRSLKHSDGLYIFDDLRKTIKKTITVNNPGFINGIKWGKGAEFDGGLALLFFKGLYYLFCRANPARGVRKIQYSRSKDLVAWEPFRLMELPYEDGKQYYYPTVFPKDKRLKAQIPVYDNDRSAIEIYWSDDGKTWTFEKEILPHSPNWCGIEPKPYFAPIQGTDRYYHENYHGLTKTKPVRIIEYDDQK